MVAQMGIPRGAIIAINDMLDCCAKILPGQEVVLLAQIDGLYGGDNLVDQEAISWIQAAVSQRGANASALWIDEKAKPHAWRFPPVVKGAVAACDVLINNSFDLEWEEMIELKQLVRDKNKIMVRNFATTSSLLNTYWAQTPYELVSEIRYQASLPFKDGLPWQLTDDNGTHLQGFIVGEFDPIHPGSLHARREETYNYRPWPEWVHPPVAIKNTSGIFIFESMLPWWSRYIGISPYFQKPIRLTIENCRIMTIEGGTEADALRCFLDTMREKLGEGVYDFKAIHFGVHPQAIVSPQQCKSVIYRRLIDHSHSSNIHVHIGAPPAAPNYPYWMHCTGDIRTATFRVGDILIHDRGHLVALDHPAVCAIAAKYPDRPGLKPMPRTY